MAPDVDIDKMAEATHGFSGADISEICQRAAKNAIRESIAYELERAAKIEAGEISEDDNADYDPVPYITKCVHCPSTRTPLALCQLSIMPYPILYTFVAWMRCCEVLFPVLLTVSPSAWLPACTGRTSRRPCLVPAARCRRLTSASTTPSTSSRRPPGTSRSQDLHRSRPSQGQKHSPVLS